MAEQEEDNSFFDEAFDQMAKAFERLPNIVKNMMKKELDELRKLVKDRRPPRFMLVGRRGSGKSEHVNTFETLSGINLE